MKVGVLVGYSGNRDLDDKFRNVINMGFTSCQLCNWHLPDDIDEDAEYIKRKCREYGVTISSFWCGWPGPAVWDFIEGPLTLGLVPPEFRFERMQYLMRGIEYAAKMGTSQLATHAGFIPEDSTDPRYPGLLVALHSLLRNGLSKYQIKFLFETGQETPVTLLRTIEDMNSEWFGINLDTGNLILYGKANPCDALDVFGKYVCDLHAKDGEYPTNGRQLGHETPLGDGKANFPGIIKKLKELNYQGPITIEREISGDQQTKDILMAKNKLEALIAE